MTEPYAIVVQSNPSIGYEIGLLSAQLTVIFFGIIIFVSILLCIVASFMNKTKNNKDIANSSNKTKMEYIKYGELYKDELTTLSTTILPTSLKKVEHSTNLKNDKMEYLYYKFDNMPSVVSNSIKNPFKMLEMFVEIIVRSCNPDNVTILLHISSPGGTAYDFEKSYDTLKRLTNAKFNTIALIDDICASGGYMLACACKHIIASNTAKIGSIGVISQNYNIAGITKQVGFESKTFTTGEYKEGFPTFTEYTQKDCEKELENLQKTFDMFKKMVTDGRGDKITNDIIFNADVWYGEKAKEYGLIDEIYCPRDYIAKLAQTSNVCFVRPQAESKSPNLFSNIIGLFESYPIYKTIGSKLFSKINDLLHNTSNTSITSKTSYLETIKVA